MEEKANKLTRREFLKTSGTAFALAGMGLGLPSVVLGQTYAKPVSANEKIILGVIGYGNRCRDLLGEFTSQPDVEIAAVCDVYEPRLRKAAAKLGEGVKTYSDFRKLLEQKDLDAVIITTPPHWHPLISIYACQSGKDVYCEKPICNRPAEARAMLKAATENKRVTQVGTQIHSTDNFHRAVEIVRSGMLGKISSVRVICTMNMYPGIERHPDSEPPKGLDWDMWLGPAPKRPFNIKRFETHNLFKDYIGSWLHELGPHIVDFAYCAMNPGEPKSVCASGGRFALEDSSDIPDTMDVLWKYDGFTMTWMHTICNGFNFGVGAAPDKDRRLGVLFHGTKGTLFTDYYSHEIISDGDLLKDYQPPAPSIPSSPGHVREFLDSIKSRKNPTCSFEYHVPLAITLNLGQIALETGRTIHWDAVNSRILNDLEAERLVTPDYRKPWTL